MTLREKIEQLGEENKFQEQGTVFLEETHTTMKVEYSRYRAVFLLSGVNAVYEVTLENQFHIYTFEFTQSVVGTQNGEVPTAYDVLACLQKSDYSLESFEDFCSEYGYEQYDDEGNEHRDNKATYEACCNEYENINELFTDEQLEALREIC